MYIYVHEVHNSQFIICITNTLTFTPLNANVQDIATCATVHPVHHAHVSTFYILHVYVLIWWWADLFNAIPKKVFYTEYRMPHEYLSICNLYSCWMLRGSSVCDGWSFRDFVLHIRFCWLVLWYLKRFSYDTFQNRIYHLLWCWMALVIIIKLMPAPFSWALSFLMCVCVFMGVFAGCIHPKLCIWCTTCKHHFGTISSWN